MDEWQTSGIETMLDFMDFINSVKLPSFDFEFLNKMRKPSPGSESGPDDPLPYLAGAGVLLSSSDDDERTHQPSDKGQFHTFIKRMIEIRRLLKLAGHSDQLRLPAIVVIGSQSSGKSSVLEAIVGHEFLPKGNNMITRRPLELTLVNDPLATRDYAVFPGGKKIYDFSKVQDILTEQNLSVSEEQCVSDEPIELVIHSAKIPDLSLVDLPGYIQINNKNQPANLKEKIARLCEKYISERNIILAISAADVDLANSEALRNSRVVDPSGERTIGVITKLDLVPPAVAIDIITRNQYPLQLGYTGVVCKKDSSFSAARTHEQKYFQNFPALFRESCGIPSLQQKLLHALEHEMYQTIDSVQENVIRELDDLDYAFKVRYNDESISVYSYISSLSLIVKEKFRNLAESFNRASIRKLVLKELEGKLLEIYERYLWTTNSEEILQNFPRALSTDDINISELAVPFTYEESFQRAISALTMSNIGRTSCSLMSDRILALIQETLSKTPFCYHGEAVHRLKEGFEGTLRAKAMSVVSQMENSLKPYKFGTEFTVDEWKLARDATLDLLKRKLKASTTAEDQIRKEVGSSKLSMAIKLIDGGIDKQVELEELTLKDPFLIQKAKEYTSIEKKISLIRHRLLILHGRNCFTPYSVQDAQAKHSSFIYNIFGWFAFWNYSVSSSRNVPVDVDSLRKKQLQAVHPVYEFEDEESKKLLVILKDPCQYLCPEVYLHLLLNRLIKTTIPVLHYELIENFCINVAPNNFPEYLLPKSEAPEGNFSLFKSSRVFPIQSDAASSFALQNPNVADQLRLQERRAILLTVKEKLSYLRLTKNSTYSKEETS